MIRLNCALLALLLFTLAACNKSHVKAYQISHDYNLCVYAEEVSDFSYAANEDYETVVIRAHGARVKIGTSLFPTEPGYAMSMRHPLLMSKSFLPRGKVTPILDIFSGSSVHKIGVTGTMKGARPALYVEMIGNEADTQKLGELMKSIRLCDSRRTNGSGTNP